MKIKVYRAMLDLTQGELGKMVGCTGTMIGNIERRKSICSVKTAIKIAKVLRVPVEEIDEFKYE